MPGYPTQLAVLRAYPADDGSMLASRGGASRDGDLLSLQGLSSLARAWAQRAGPCSCGPLVSTVPKLKAIAGSTGPTVCLVGWPLEGEFAPCLSLTLHDQPAWTAPLLRDALSTEA